MDTPGMYSYKKLIARHVIKGRCTNLSLMRRHARSVILITVFPDLAWRHFHVSNATPTQKKLLQWCLKTDALSVILRSPKQVRWRACFVTSVTNHMEK